MAKTPNSGDIVRGLHTSSDGPRRPKGVVRRASVEAVLSVGGHWQVRYVDSGGWVTTAKNEAVCRKVVADLNAGVQAAWDACGLSNPFRHRVRINYR